MGMLAGKVAVVTGAGRGIGREIALQMARAGARVVVNDLGTTAGGEGQDVSVAQQVVDEIRTGDGEAVASTDSVTSWQGGHSIVQTALDNFGRIDIVVNNAGILRDRMVFKMSEEDWQTVLDVHLRGTFHCHASGRTSHARAEGWPAHPLHIDGGPHREFRPSQLRRSQDGNRGSESQRGRGHAEVRRDFELHRSFCLDQDVCNGPYRYGGAERPCRKSQEDEHQPTSPPWPCTSPATARPVCQDRFSVCGAKKSISSPSPVLSEACTTPTVGQPRGFPPHWKKP